MKGKYVNVSADHLSNLRCLDQPLGFFGVQGISRGPERILQGSQRHSSHVRHHQQEILRRAGFLVERGQEMRN